MEEEEFINEDPSSIIVKLSTLLQEQQQQKQPIVYTISDSEDGPTIPNYQNTKSTVTPNCPSTVTPNCPTTVTTNCPSNKKQQRELQVQLQQQIQQQQIIIQQQAIIQEQYRHQQNQDMIIKQHEQQLRKLRTWPARYMNNKKKEKYKKQQLLVNLEPQNQLEFILNKLANVVLHQQDFVLPPEKDAKI
jgi:hypothetical protein